MFYLQSSNHSNISLVFPPPIPTLDFACLSLCVLWRHQDLKQNVWSKRSTTPSKPWSIIIHHCITRVESNVGKFCTKFFYLLPLITRNLLLTLLSTLANSTLIILFSKIYSQNGRQKIRVCVKMVCNSNGFGNPNFSHLPKRTRKQHDNIFAGKICQRPTCLLRASPSVLSMWFQTVKFIVTKSKCAGLDQEIGFFASNSCILPWLVKGATQLCTSKKECNQLDLTAAQ
jgi:hypothetical protein